MNAVQVGNYFRRDVFIVQLHRNGFPSRVLRLHKAWPVSWTAPDLDTGTSEVSMESLTLAFESCNMILTRANEMPTLDDLAASVGRLSRFVADTTGQAIGTLEAIGEGVEDLFDGDAYDTMGEAFLMGTMDDGSAVIPPGGDGGYAHEEYDGPENRQKAWAELFKVFNYGREAGREGGSSRTYTPQWQWDEP